jgi:hypothetical protein
MSNTISNETAPGTCDSEGLKNFTNNFDSPTTDAPGKAFEALVTGFAQAGHTLRRSEAKDGTVIFWVSRWGMERFLPNIDAARRFLDQIGGRL